jgi:UDP:flavonoid glycosyltransferase YjiC (YdhE family)
MSSISNLQSLISQSPISNMQIGLIAYGTRGDVQPVLALALALQQRGHEVRVLAGANFGDWVRGQGLAFAPIDVDVQALMNSELGTRWVEGKPWEQPEHMRRAFHSVSKAFQQGVLQGSQGLDALMGSFTCDAFGLAVAQKQGIPYLRFLFQPFYPTRAGSATLIAPRPRSNSLFNLWMGYASEHAIYTVFSDDMHDFRRELDLPAYTEREFLEVWHRLPTFYAFSKHVVPLPEDWPASSQIGGYWFLDEETQHLSKGSEPFERSPLFERLCAFLSNGPPPVYIGFGSATTSDPHAAAQLIFDAVKMAGARAVLARGWSLSHDIYPPDDVCVVDSVPHSWLFSRVAGVVHHGGAGTTAAGLRAGKPTFIVPHFAEQPFWGRRVHELGVGVKPVHRSKLTAQKLAAGLTQLLQDEGMHQHAAELGKRIAAEDGLGNAVRWIEAQLRNKL